MVQAPHVSGEEIDQGKPVPDHGRLFARCGHHPVPVRVERHRGSDNGCLLPVHRGVETDTFQALELGGQVVDGSGLDHEPVCLEDLIPAHRHGAIHLAVGIEGLGNHAWLPGPAVTAGWRAISLPQPFVRR